MSFRFLVVLLGLNCSPLLAQVNTESLRPVPADSGVSGTLGADLAVKTGNVELVDLGLRGRVDIPGRRLTTFLVGEATLGLLKGQQFTSTGLAHLRQSYPLTPRLAWEWYGQVNYDKPRLIDFRGLLGTGLRVRLLDRGPNGAWAGSSIMMEHERLELPPAATHPARTNVARLSNYISLRASSGEHLSLSMTTYVQPWIVHPGDLRILENLQLAVGITREIAMSVRFDLRYDSRPPDGIESLDTTLHTGVSIGF